MVALQHQPQMAVLGGGAWGTALACVLAQQHAAVTLWAHEADTVKAINEAHENPQFLPEGLLQVLENLCCTEKSENESSELFQK